MSLSAGAFALSRPRVGASRWRRVAGRIDWTLLLTILILASAGLANLYSATLRTQHQLKFTQQLVWMGTGLAFYVALTALDYRTMQKLAWVALVGTIAVIIAVRVLGSNVNGSQRWLSLGPLRIQPSELAKIAVILSLARLFQDASERTLSPDRVAIPLLGIATPVVLIAWQPDLGSATLLALIGISMGLLLLKTLWPLNLALVFGVIGLPLLWDQMRQYQRSRVLSFLDPGSDPTGAGWQTVQSIKAVGSGQMSGKGYLNATQNHFDFLPEHWTDFPFSVWAEEWGFVGSVALLGVFAFLVLWILNVALGARDAFGQAVCVGVAAMLFWHVLVNVLMVLGFAPVVGVTLPLISYGGSSVITFFIGLGLVSSVSMRRQRY